MLTCPGTSSEKELAIPIKGFFIPSLLTPVAYNKALCGALLIPTLTLSLFIIEILSTIINHYKNIFS
jgi:hypothetical protein